MGDLFLTIYVCTYSTVHEQVKRYTRVTRETLARDSRDTRERLACDSRGNRIILASVTG